MRRTTIADSRRSPRYFGKILPVLGSPTWWPARPMRWRPRETEPGDSTSTTRSTAPMSIPSSRLLVATMARRLPLLRSDSTCRRCSRDERSVVRAHELLARELVEVRGEPLGGAARVAEHDASCGARGSARARAGARGARCSCWPRDRRGRARRAVAPEACECAPGSVMSSTGTITSTSSSLREPASTMVTGRASLSVWPPRKRAISSSGRCVAESPMRCGGPVGDRLEPLERQHQVRAALGGRERVDLVDDYRLDAAQDLARLRREHQVERLGCRDQDVGRRARELLAILGGRVAGAHARPSAA